MFKAKPLVCVNYKHNYLWRYGVVIVMLGIQYMFTHMHCNLLAVTFMFVVWRRVSNSNVMFRFRFRGGVGV